MFREFEIFSKTSLPSVAVKRGFSWPGFFFHWIWAFSRGLIVPGIVLLAIDIGFIALRFTAFRSDPFTFILLRLLVALVVGLRGNSWRSRKLEKNGYEFKGLVEARSPASAISAYSMGKKYAGGGSRGSLVAIPKFAQGLLAVAGLTWKAALRFRLFLVIAGLLLIAVVGLPILIKDDGTARGFTQILLTYTLSAITALLGISTLWLSCGTLARDIEECQMQVVATKPISRWQIWLGKWLGIISLNAVLLVLSGICVYGLLQWRSTKLPEKEQAILHNQVLVARSSAKPEDLQPKIDKYTTEILDERLKQTQIQQADLPEVKKQIAEQVKAEFQIVPSGAVKQWRIDLGSAAKSLQNEPLQMRIKFNAALKSASGTFIAGWRVGDPPHTKSDWRSEAMSLAPDTFHEITIPPGLIAPDGTITIAVANPNSSALLFPLEDGMEVLYRDGGFGLNFARGMGIIFCWMALLAAIGLASASFLSFPVASFLSLSLLLMALSSGTLAGVVSEGTIDGSAQADKKTVAVLDTVIVPTFRVALQIIDLARDYSPIDSLSTGRSITWTELGMAFVRIVVVLGGIFAVFGIFVFNRRELATAQSQS